MSCQCFVNVTEALWFARLQYGTAQIIILHLLSDPDTLCRIVFPYYRFAKFKRISENMAKDNANGRLFPWTTVMLMFWKRQIWHHQEVLAKGWNIVTIFIMSSFIPESVFISFNCIISLSTCFQTSDMVQKVWFSNPCFYIHKVLITIGQWSPQFRSRQPCYLLNWGSILQQMFSRCGLVWFYLFG